MPRTNLKKELMATGFSEIETALAKSDFVAARAQLKRALSLTLSPEARSSYLGLLSAILHGERRHGMGLRYRAEALRLTPDDPYTRLSMVSDMLNFSRQYRQALEQLEPLLGRKHVSRPYLHWTYNLAGLLHLKLGEPGKAQDFFYKMRVGGLPARKAPDCSLAIALLESGHGNKDVVRFLQHYVQAKGEQRKINSLNIAAVRKLLKEHGFGRR